MKNDFIDAEENDDSDEVNIVKNTEETVNDSTVDTTGKIMINVKYQIFLYSTNTASAIEMCIFCTV